jgi:hypothetical protein
MVEEKIVKEKDMLTKCREFLIGQKLQTKLTEGKELMFKYKDLTLFLNPMHPKGNPILGRRVTVNVTKMNEFNELWEKTNARFSLDENFDDWFFSSLTGHPQITGKAPTQAFIFYNFESESELNAIIGQRESFMGYCEKLKVYGDYMLMEDKKV